MCLDQKRKMESSCHKVEGKGRVSMILCSINSGECRYRQVSTSRETLHYCSLYALLRRTCINLLKQHMKTISRFSIFSSSSHFFSLNFSRFTASPASHHQNSPSSPSYKLSLHPFFPAHPLSTQVMQQLQEKSKPE